MSDDQPSSPIHSGGSSPENNNHATTSTSNNNGSGARAVDKNDNNNVVGRRERPSRACTVRSAARLHAAAAAEAAVVAAVRKQKPSRKERRAFIKAVEEEEEEELPPSPPHPFSKVVTSLVGEPPPSQLPRWNIRSMWEMASILNFLNVFRPLLNIKVEFSVEEFETSLITPNNLLADVHIPLLKAIPPITRMALGRNTWVTVLCRKLRDWWHWVAEGDLPIVASHGAEVEAYNMLDPAIRVVILKALCDIRVEQEDIRNYIDDSIKHGVPPSSFRKERTGGDSYGISYWYEDDPVIGQRLYREIRKVEVKKGKGKSVQPIPNSCYQWETVATNLDEFQDVSEKLSLSKNRTEASLGKKLKIDMLPEIEKVQKRKEKLLKKQQRQALLLDNMMNVDGLGPGRSLRGRKPVSYTFDDFDRSINEAIKITKRKPPSPEPTSRRDGIKHENGRWDGTSQIPQHFSFNAQSPGSPDFDETDEDHKSEQLDRSNRRRQRPQRYSAKEYVEAVSENEADFDSDDDIVGEAVYDEEYLRKRKERRKVSSSSEGDEEYLFDGENAEEEEEEEEGDDSSSASDGSDQPRKFKKLPGRTRRETKLRSVDELQSGLRRSKRATRNRIDYTKYDQHSESDPELPKTDESNGSEKQTDGSASDNVGFSMGSEGTDGNDDSEDNLDNEDNEDNLDKEDNEDNLDNVDYEDNLDNVDNEDNLDNEDKGDDLDTKDNEDNIDNEAMEIDKPAVEKPGIIKEEQVQPPKKVNNPDQDEFGGAQKRRFLDLNELAPGSGFDDSPMMKDDDTDVF